MKTFIRGAIDQIVIFICLFVCLVIGSVGIIFYAFGSIGKFSGKTMKKLLKLLKQFVESSNTLKQDQKEKLSEQLKDIK